MTNYTYRAQILESGLPTLVQEIDRAIYADRVLQDEGRIIKTKMDVDTANKMRCSLISQDKQAYDEACRINEARRHKTARARGIIRKLVDEHDVVVFLTLTFRDTVLASTNAKTRRVYVRQYLNTYGVNFVGNVDFGAKNGREHYHVLIGSRVDPKAWKYGSANVEYVKSPDKLLRVPKSLAECSPEMQESAMRYADVARTSKYISKLSNHAIKATTAGSRLLIGRPEWKDEQKRNLEELHSDYLKLQELESVCDVRVGYNGQVRLRL